MEPHVTRDAIIEGKLHSYVHVMDDHQKCKQNEDVRQLYLAYISEVFHNCIKCTTLYGRVCNAARHLG